jgi:DNA invertase Pin-like site-specific DNA recombinase
MFATTLCARKVLEATVAPLLALTLTLGPARDKTCRADGGLTLAVPDLFEGGRAWVRARRAGPRSRAEADEDRRRVDQDTAAEIDRLAAEFERKLPRSPALAVGVIYARYSTQWQQSIADQVRCCYETALKQKVFVPRENVCFDAGVRGYKERRPGLQRLREVLEAGAAQVLLVFSTNRLFRKTYKALQFVEEEAVERGVRCLLINSGVDTSDDKRWRMLLQAHTLIDEAGAGMYADNIRAGQEGLFDKKLVWGTITFGYRGKEVAGPPTRRKTPRREYEIDPEQAAWIQRVFHWYATDGLPIVAIVRQLNDDPLAPLGPRTCSGRWTRLAVRLLLSNERYRGQWAYGKTKAIWQSKKDYVRQVPGFEVDASRVEVSSPGRHRRAGAAGWSPSRG